MFFHGEPIKEDIMLGTDAHGFADLLHISMDIKPLNDSSATRWCVQT